MTAACAAVILVIMAGIFVELVSKSWLSIQRFGWAFLGSREWNPVAEEFGALPSIYGTLVSTVVAMVLAVPMALLIALFLVELAPPQIGHPVGVAIELLAAVPSIIYGMWGLFVFSPYMADHIQPFLNETVQPILDRVFFGYLPLFEGAPIGIGMLTAGIILALMILPFMTAITRDVLRMVPPVLKESAYGMGSTTWEVTWKVSIPYGIHGIIGALFLGLGRAIGETMAVTFVIGNTPILSGSLLDAGQSIASTLANEFAEASEPLYLSALIELALILFLLTFVIQIASHLWLKRVSRHLEGRG
jgi:phosphate transport system permease protein